MNSFRYPVLVWEDHAGCFTAGLVDGPDDLAALGQSPEMALRQLRENLVWTLAQNTLPTEADFLNPSLTQIKVTVQPEYREDRENKHEIYPAPDTVTLLVPCVHGTRASGIPVCALPTLGIRFNHFDSHSVRSLAAHYATGQLKNLNPRQLSRHLPPKSVALQEISVRPTRKSRSNQRFWHSPPSTTTLQTVADPINATGKLSARFSLAWGRDADTQSLTRQILANNGSLLLVGSPGGGKSTVIARAFREAARLGREEKDHDAKIDPTRFWSTSAARIVAGMKYLGQWEERCEALVAELSGALGTLWIENLLDLIGTGGEDPGSSIAAFLLPYLQRGELRLVAEASPAELESCRRLFPGLVDLFQIIHLPPFSDAEARQVLTQMSHWLESNLHLEIDREVPALVQGLFARFLPYNAFPGKTAAFYRNLAERAATAKQLNISPDHALQQFIKISGLPGFILRDDLPLDRTHVLHALQEKVIGQPAACQVMANVVTTFKAGLNDPARPVGVLLFCGPTGVGKTALARATADFIFGHGSETDRLLRLDMSEYAGPDAAGRLVRNPDGNPSDLIRRARQQPFIVLLFDEIEKAASEVFDVLLNLFDEGRLADRHGRVTFFRSAIVILTSNLGAQNQAAVGFTDQETSYESAVMKAFRPEFFNRLDAVVAFNPLDPDSIRTIATKELQDLARREGFVAANLRLRWTEAVTALLTQTGFDPKYGARPLQRALEKLVVTPLARHLAEHPTLRDAEIQLDLDQHRHMTFVVNPGPNADLPVRSAEPKKPPKQ